MSSTALNRRIAALERVKPPAVTMPTRIWICAKSHDGTVTRGGCIVVKPIKWGAR